MKQVYFATKNKGKVSSISSALSEYGIEVVQVPLDINEPRTDDLREIARQKVLAAYNQVKKPCIALDSGFYIHSLNGFPKTFVNFALETIGVDGILKLAENLGKECEFRNCLAYYDETLKEPMIFESAVPGTLATEKRGEMPEHAWSELWLIFMPTGLDRTIAEMTYEEYIEWRKTAHKESYTTKFAEWLVNNK